MMAMIAMIGKGSEGVEVTLFSCCEEKRGLAVNSLKLVDVEEEGKRRKKPEMTRRVEVLCCQS